MNEILLSPEMKEACRQVIELRTREITQDILSEVLKLKPVSKTRAGHRRKEAEIYILIQTKIDAAYRLGAKDGSYTLAFLLVQ